MPSPQPACSAGPPPAAGALAPADLAAAFAALPGAAAVFAADAPHHTVLAASDALLAAAGRPREAVVGRPLAEAFPNASPDDPAAGGLASLRASVAAAVRTGAAQRMSRQRYDLQRPDGAWEARYWDAVNIPLAGPGGAVRSVLHQTEDVTARVRGEEALARAEHGARATLARIADAYIVLDREFRFVDVNPAAERSMRKTRAELVGRSHWDVFPASPDLGGGRHYRRAAREGLELHFTEHYRHEGYDVHREMDAYPTDNGGVAVFWRDVTARVQAEAERGRLLAESEAARAAFARANQQLREQAAELEAQAEALRATTAHLEAQAEAAGRARAVAEAERARAAGVLERMADAYFALDADFRFVAANAAMARTAGVPPERLLGRSLWDVFPGARGTTFERHYRAAMAGAEAHFTHDYADARLDLVAEVDVYPGPEGADGRPGVVVFWRDVTARRRAEAALAASEARFRAVQDASPDALVLLRPVYAEGHAEGHADGAIVDFEVVYGNSAAGRMLGGGAADALLGRRMLTVFPGSAAEGYFGAYARAFATGVPYTREDRYVRDGLDVGLRVTAVRAGDLVHLRHEDVAERLRAEAERARLLAESEAARASAEAANRAKGDFLAVMSHELRTPLNAIGGYAQLMELGLHGPVTPEQLTALGRIQRGQQHLLGLINSVLNYAKLEAGHVQYHPAPVPAAELLAEAAALVAPQARAKGLALAVAPCPPDLVARADGEKAGQVLLNLLSNAVKFTRGGGVVTVAGARGPGGRVALTVADTGRGIPADQLARVFEPFVQVDQRLTRAQEGTGLGLAISRDLARGMGGDLTAESTPGVGSTFTLTLPAA